MTRVGSYDKLPFIAFGTQIARVAALREYFLCTLSARARARYLFIVRACLFRMCISHRSNFVVKLHLCVEDETVVSLQRSDNVKLIGRMKMCRVCDFELALNCKISRLGRAKSVSHTLYVPSVCEIACKLRISSVRRLHTGRPMTLASSSHLEQKRVVIAADIYTFVTLPRAVT